MAVDPIPVKRQDTIVREHPSRNVIEATFEERHRLYNKSNESVAQRGEAGRATQGMKPEPCPSPDADWVVVQPALSITDSSGVSSGEANNHRASTPGAGQELTAKKLQLHNMMLEKGLPERIWEKEGHRSVIAKKGKGTTTRASNNSVDLTGPWVPISNSDESDIVAIGSWADSPLPPGLSNLSLY